MTMGSRRRDEPEPPQPLTGGIAGGPGPTPPGFTDGTEPAPPAPGEAAVPSGGGGVDGAGRREREAGEESGEGRE